MMHYLFDLRMVCGGYAYFATFTHGSRPGIAYEVRTPSEVDKDRVAVALTDIGEQSIYVDSKDSYEAWMYCHGWAVVEEEFARSTMPQWLKKHRCVISGAGSFTDVEIASPSVLRRTLRGKFKQKILDRDGNRCLLCSDTEDLTLQHVWPHSVGGETSSGNLVTLCAPCNQQLGAEFHPGLFDLAGIQATVDGPFVVSSDLSERAFIRARYLTRNIMYTRCDTF
ncbi:HNH endonuclease [Burkholderia glumae]|uniref:HNH endonuclease n=2 Tax=Burkholderia glumae TaxID=337 RepID=UPI003D8023BB